jgi:ornithine carbamoyltransferase
MHHLLSVSDLDPSELAAIVHLAGEAKREPERFRESLRGRSIGLFFMKQSLRTWVSCDVAAIQVGIHPVVIRNEQAGLGTRETPADVGRVLERYLDLVAMRVFDHHDLEATAGAVEIPVVNLLSDREHPCQAIADLQTIAEHRPIEDAVVAYVGDGNNVAHSLALGVAMMGGTMRIASPAGHQPDPAVVALARRYSEVEVVTDPREAVAGADVVYTDVWTSMGQEQEAEARKKIFEPYRVDRSLFDTAAADAIFLHCLPAHRGEEVTDEMMEHPRSRVFDQAENRLHSFKAILLTALG